MYDAARRVGLLAQNMLEGHTLAPAINRASWLAGAVGAYAVAVGAWLLFWQSGGLGLTDSSDLRHAGIWVFLLVSATARASGAELVFARRGAAHRDLLDPA